MVPMDVAFPGVASGSISENKALDSSVQVSKLSNGMQVVSVDGGYPMTSVGAFINSGSRHETDATIGVHSFLESMAFKSTMSRTDFRLVREMLRLGCNVTAQASREHMTYFGDSLRDNSHEIVATLADVIQNPMFSPDEVSEAVEAYKHMMPRKAGADMQVMEAIHGAAYGFSTLGRPTGAPEHSLGRFTSGELDLKSWCDANFTPQKTVLAGVGIEHEYLVDLASKHFGGWTYAPSGSDAVMEKAVYTGGDWRVHRAEEPLTHVAIAFQTADWHHADLVPMCVLQMMMGGGGSFSAGGPGKGMYSRLYRNVLNQYNWVESITCFNSIFNDSALFGFHGMTAPSYAEQLTIVMLDEAKKMASGVNAVELTRAKNQLKSAVQMHLDSRNMRVEDIGRQMATYGSVESGADICAKIEKVTPEDITRVAKDMLSTPLTFAAYGDVTKVPRFDEMWHYMQQ